MKKNITYSSKNSKNITKYSKNSSKKAIYNCELGHEWTAQIRKINQGSSCPYCSFKKPLPGYNTIQDNKHLLQYYSTQNTIDSSTITYKNSVQKILWKCPDCGYDWKQTPFLIQQNTKICPSCSGRIKTQHNSVKHKNPELTQWIKNSEDLNKYYNSREKILFCCPKESHLFYSTIYSLKKNLKCPQCSSLKITHPHLEKEWNDQKNFNSFSKGSRYKAQWKCQKCSHTWKATIYNKVKGSNCPQCSLGNKSKQEKEVLSYIKSFYDSTIIANDRKTIPGVEIDILIPKNNIGIEYNGVYWHLDSKISKKYHLNKYLKCREQGTFLISIYEDQWIHKKELVKNKIKTYLNNKTMKIKYETVEISESEAEQLCDTYSLTLFHKGVKYFLIKDVGVISINEVNVGILHLYSTHMITTELLSYIFRSLSTSFIFIDNNVEIIKNITITSIEDYVTYVNEKRIRTLSYSLKSISTSGFSKVSITDITL